MEGFMNWRFSVRNEEKKTVLTLTGLLLPALLAISGAVNAANPPDTAYAVGARHDDRLGYILTDSAGRTLYTFSKDTPLKSHCTASCETFWSPLLSTGGLATASPGMSGELEVTQRSDATLQLSYNGKPLYRSNLDREPGDTRGNGMDGQWFAANVEPTVQMRQDANGTTYLAGPDGMTLYRFKKDQEGTGTCTQNCAGNWPPLVIASRPLAPAGLGGTLGTIKRAPPDNRLQVTYEGQPLYYWHRDRQPGDTTGDGIGDIWSIVKPVVARE
jgi:predicted lipoprotein with Yx(FWY)xxD motif